MNDPYHPAAYCFFQEIEPRPTFEATFERDYLLYAVSGALRVTVGADSWLLPPSFASWVPAHTRLVVDLAKPVTSCSVLVRPSFCTALPQEPTVFQMSPLARHMIRHCKDWGPDDPQPDEAEGFFRSLLNVCADLAKRSINVKRPLATDPMLQHAIRLTQDRLGEHLSAAEVARASNMSERTMQRKFADDVGLTWSQTLTRLRMIKAVELLADPDLPVIQIAADCGFNSLSAFNRAFRAFSGTTPSEFRRGLTD